ncbi:KR domain-containing protein, partial [Streptomyces sp. NPDC056486]|uniref:KR domain-containing protein n=1 Tax=Streptomyces sp. NPDC056486 TaxID=3345835 RepID=UPI00368C930D
IQDATITTLTPEQLDDVLRPKTDAAWNLHHATRHLNLDAFILYSSLAATLGSPGQANYAAANACLSALAHHRHTQNLPATSIEWGPWGDSRGMAGQLSETDVARITRTGFPLLSTEDALDLLDVALTFPEQPVVIGTAVSPAALRAPADDGSLQPLLRDLVRGGPRRGASAVGSPAAAASAATAAESLATLLADLDEAGQQQHLLGLVRQTTASILAYSDLSDVPPQLGFLDMGLDSLSTIELRNALGGQTGLRLPATLVFDHPTPAALARHLQRLIPFHKSDGHGQVDVLGDLRQLDSSLSSVSVSDGALRTEIRDQLRALLKAFEAASPLGTEPRTQANQAGQPTGEQVADELRSASTDEVLRFIDREFSAGSDFSDTLHISHEAVSDGE